MSLADNVARLRAMLDATNRRDVDAVLAHIHPDCEIRPLRSATEGTYHGPEGARRFLEDSWETFQEFGADSDTFQAKPVEAIPIACSST